jgi:cell division protein FtsB
MSGGRLARASRLALRRHWLSALALLGVAYFAYHALHGDRGVYAWRDVNLELAQVRAELAAVEARNAKLQEIVDGLQPDRLDPDLLEEELLRLGYVGARDVVILEAPQGAESAPGR